MQELKDKMKKAQTTANQANFDETNFADHEAETVVDLTVEDEICVRIKGGIGLLLPAVQKV